MRRFGTLVVLGVALAAAPSAWGAPPSLRADHRIAQFDDRVRFSGTLPTPEPQQVALVRDGAVVARTTGGAGVFMFELRARRAGVFVARTAFGDSAPVVLRVKPRLRIHIRRGYVVGRLLPARSGRLVLRSRHRSAPVRVGSAGRFRVAVPARWGPSVTGRVELAPARGYVLVWRRVRVRRVPSLRVGSHGPAVLALKERLRELHYALPSVDSGFGQATYEAVLAFQKVNGLPRSGRVGPELWRRLWRASVPRARVPRGDYLEVDKARQVLFEVRTGQVVNVIHVSTGATGNTPLGTWRVYSEIAGWSWVLWQPMYFLRGFAIHGYPWVPPWPASHGCVRVPMWLATSLRERWGYGSIVRVYA